MATPNLPQTLLAHLTSHNLPPTQTWLTTFLASIRPNTPLQALQKTALFRLLSTDITTTTTLAQQPSACFPPDIHNANIVSRILAGPITVQILDVEDIGHSRWSQLEALEAQERGEMTKGREIIRVVPGEVDANNDADATASVSAGPHKLVLQDGKGVRVYGLEMRGIDGVGVNMSIGSKMVVRNVEVARGVVLLGPESVVVLGGKIEGLHRAWREGRKERLKRDAGMVDGDG